jgi:hypothetical protein
MMSQWRGPSHPAVAGLWDCVRVLAWLLAASFFICFPSWLLFCEGGQTSKPRISSTLSDFMPPSNKTETDSLAVAVVLALELAKIASVLVRSLRTRIVPNHSAFRKRNPAGRIVCRPAIKNDSGGDPDRAGTYLHHLSSACRLSIA